jgi:MOSC domain-containing protein
LASIRLYPVKSLRGIATPDTDVQPWGLRHDRRWLVLKPHGTVLTARTWHSMLSLSAAPLDTRAIASSGRNGAMLHVEPPVDGEFIPTFLSRLQTVRPAGHEASAWLSRKLGTPARLGWFDDPHRRMISVDHGGRLGEALNLSDAGPVLLTTVASLRQLNDWALRDADERGEEAPAPMVMDRFRPTIVVDESAGPFLEDMWRHVWIGSVRFRFAEHCDRCVLATIDPRTLIAGKEPLRTLARHRQWDHKTWFGIRLIPVAAGRIQVGDRVEVEPSAQLGASVSRPTAPPARRTPLLREGRDKETGAPTRIKHQPEPL